MEFDFEDSNQSSASCALETIVSDSNKTQTNANNLLINNTIPTKKISAAHKKLQALIENGQLEVKKCIIPKNETILLDETLTVQKTKKNITDSWFFQKLGPNAVAAEENRRKKIETIDVKNKLNVKNYDIFKNKIENKLSEKRKEDMERRHCVYNADNEVFSNKDDDEEEEEEDFTDEEIEEYDSDLNKEDKIESENEDNLSDKSETNKTKRLKRKNSFQNKVENYNTENSKRIKYSSTNEDDFESSTDPIIENESNESLSVNKTERNVQQNIKLDSANSDKINKSIFKETSAITLVLNNGNDNLNCTKSQDFKEALFLCSGTFSDSNENVISTKESNSETENFVGLRSSSLFGESDNESVKSDWDVNIEKKTIKKRVVSDSETEENVEEVKDLNNPEFCEPTKHAENPFENLFSDDQLFTVEDDFEDKTQSSANYDNLDKNSDNEDDYESENEEEKENVPKRKIKLKDILDDEASLSGDDIDSDSDNESDGENEYEKEEGDDDVLPDSEEIRENLVKQYIKQTNDDEERRMLRLQEQFFADSDLHGSKNADRSFRFRMRDDADVDWSKILGKLDEDGENKTESDDDELEENEEIKELNGRKIEMLRWKLEEKKKKSKFNNSGAESIEIFTHDPLISLGEKIESTSTTFISEEKKIVNFKTQRDSLLNKASSLKHMFKESFKTNSTETQHSLFMSVKKN